MRGELLKAFLVFKKLTLDLAEERRPASSFFFQDSRSVQHDGTSVRSREEERCHHLLSWYVGLAIVPVNLP